MYKRGRPAKRYRRKPKPEDAIAIEQPPIDNEHVAEGCEQFSTMPPVEQLPVPEGGLNDAHPVPLPVPADGVVTLKVLRPVPNPRLVSCLHPDGRHVLLQVRDNRNYIAPLEVQARQADFRADLFAVVGERAGRDPRSRGRWKVAL